MVLQQLHSAEMLEMHQRTREAVDSIVQHYQVVCCVCHIQWVSSSSAKRKV